MPPELRPRGQVKKGPRKPNVKRWPLDDAAIQWFANRGISKETLDRNQIFLDKGENGEVCMFVPKSIGSFV